VGNSEQMSGELHITFCTNFLNLLINLLFVIQLDVLLVYHEFDNKSKNQPLFFALNDLKKKVKPYMQISGA